MAELPGDQVLKGMVKEVNNLSEMGTGDLMTLEQVEQLKAKSKLEIKVITCRWVTTRKTVDTVRSRIVIKDIAQKGSESARSLGISSPTPSADAFMLVVGLAAVYDFVIMSADVAHAFMATPLRVRDVVIRLPLSVSTMSGAPLFLHLSKALNGLRKASQDWMAFLSDIVKGIGTGLSSCNLEPCLFTGRLKSGPCCLLVYVDDLLLMTPTVEDAEKIFDAIGKHVDLKRTGALHTSKAGGGSLRFLGRVITRQKGESSILVSLPSDYLDDTFKAYGLSGKGSAHPPDVALHVEKEGGEPLSPEAFSRFRSALGKVAWMSQTRQDLRAYISILACQQASPTNFTEHGLRALLRFLQTDMSVVVRLPASSDVLKPTKLFGEHPHMVCFSDASHAPLRATKRRGISGGVLSVFGFVVKTLSRHQQMISLSSMESDLFALQAVAQEMSSLGKLLGRIFMSFGESRVSEFPGVLFSDSESSLKLLRNLDLPRRSRHLEIRVEWLKARVTDGLLILEFRKGTANPSDLLTKCLGSATFGIHRSSLGFETLGAPLASLTKISRAFVFVEVCCRPQSSIALVCQEWGVGYIGVVSGMEKESVFRQVKDELLRLNCNKVWIHVSPPCSSGSPLRNFHGHDVKESDFEWFEVFPHVKRYLRLSEYSSFELP